MKKEAEARGYRIVNEISEGWSGDWKYLVEKDGRKYLLRISNISMSGRRERDFHMLQELSKSEGIKMSVPQELWKSDEAGKVYMIFNWIEGVKAADVIGKESAAKKMQYGETAGKYLRIIHQCKTLDADWENRFGAKIDKKTAAYQRCGLTIEHDNAILNYIADNRCLLKNRPVTLQHGDYHIGNFIINPKDESLYVIDFDRMDFGDPWEEFAKIVWCKAVSKEFAYGRIRGYFAGTIPESFWRLLGLYMAFQIISSIAWAAGVSGEQVDVMMKQPKEILDDYENFSRIIPKWVDEVC